MPVADPLARPDLSLRIDKHLRDADYVDTHTIEIGLPPAEVWTRLPAAINRARMGPVGTILFRASDIARGDFRFRRRPRRRKIELREGEDVGSLFGPYEPGSFVLADVDEGRELVVHAEHRFAEGVFGLALEPDDGNRTLVYSVTRARFTGTIPSHLYRFVVTAVRGPIVEAGLRRLKQKIEAEPSP